MERRAYHPSFRDENLCFDRNYAAYPLHTAKLSARPGHSTVASMENTKKKPEENKTIWGSSMSSFNHFFLVFAYLRDRSSFMAGAGLNEIGWVAKFVARFITC